MLSHAHVALTARFVHREAAASKRPATLAGAPNINLAKRVLGTLHLPVFVWPR